MKQVFSEFDAAMMRRALALARRGLGWVEPNPMVGAVLVRNGKVIGEGYHRRYGGPHAEVEALRAAGRAPTRSATLYVTLEPCCHWGKTPPCTDAILAAGIGRVVMAMVDPFARVHGRGAALLRRSGIRVESGLLEAEAHDLNAPFITRIQQNRPFVIAKWAQSVDGCIATARGESRWISSEISRQAVHVLRGRVDGILVGLGTALADDPLLTARPARARDLKRIATRIVLDSQCRLPVTSQLVRTLSEAPLLVVHAARLTRSGEARRRKLAACGVMLHGVPAHSRAGGQGALDLHALLKYLGTLDYTNLLVEGGGATLGSFARRGLIDEAHVFIAPFLLGGANARHAVGGAELHRLADASRLRLIDVKQSGPDIHMTLRR